MSYPLLHGVAARPLRFRLYLTADGTPAAGKTASVQILKANAANSSGWGAPAGAVTDMGHGVYQVAANVADVDILGPLTLRATAASNDCDEAQEEFDVVAFDARVAYAVAGDAMTLTTGERTAIGAALAARVLEGSITWEGAFRIILAGDAGNTTGMNTVTGHIRDIGNTKDRVTATLDGAGNRVVTARDGT